MANLEVKVTEKKAKTEGEKPAWEGTVSVPGLKPTKLTRKDGSTLFSTKATVSSAAKRLATSLGFDGVETATPAKKAAKKSATKKNTKSTCCGGTPCCETTT